MKVYLQLNRKSFFFLVAVLVSTIFVACGDNKEILANSPAQHISES
jgi:hypothetical protein